MTVHLAAAAVAAVAGAEPAFVSRAAVVGLQAELPAADRAYAYACGDDRILNEPTGLAAEPCAAADEQTSLAENQHCSWDWRAIALR